MREFFKNNGLSLVLFGLFFFSMVGQYFTGYQQCNDDRQSHRKSKVSYVEYFGEGHFIEVVFENWESEFLSISAISAMVLLSVRLRQKGSPESKPVDAAQSDTGTS